MKKQSMPRAPWYSSQLGRDLVKRLCFRAKAESIPTTRLANRIIAGELAREETDITTDTPRIAEESTANEPRGETQHG